MQAADFVFSVPRLTFFHALCMMISFLSAGMMELADMRDLGAVTSVKVFSGA